MKNDYTVSVIKPSSQPGALLIMAGGTDRGFIRLAFKDKLQAAQYAAKRWKDAHADARPSRGSTVEFEHDGEKYYCVALGGRVGFVMSEQQITDVLSS